VREADGSNPVPGGDAGAREFRRGSKDVVRPNSAQERLGEPAQRRDSSRGEAIENQRRVSLRLEPHRPIGHVLTRSIAAVEQDDGRVGDQPGSA
jgi:hypothetical protein